MYDLISDGFLVPQKQFQSLNDLIIAEDLPEHYLSFVERFFRPIAQAISSSSDCFILAIQGSQGSGKSTCAKFLKSILETDFSLRTVVLSIDDFYFTKAEREALGRSIHPLLRSRGVPGTHDVTLALETLAALKDLKEGGELWLPRFDKAVDDRLPKSAWDKVRGKVDLVIFEGWCVALEPESEEALVSPINDLEKEEDSDGRWRSYVNEQLAGVYQDLFAQFDKLLVLEAPSFDCVYAWRLEQEQKMIAQLKARGLDSSKAFTATEIRRFVSYFERLSRHSFKTLTKRADFCLKLDKDHNFTEASGACFY